MGLRCVFFHTDIQLFKQHLLIVLSPLNWLYSFSRDQLTVILWVCFWASVLFVGLFCPFLIQYHTVSIAIAVGLEIGKRQSCGFVFLLHDCAGRSGSPASSYKLQNQFIDVRKIACWDFGGACVESINNVEKN